MKTKSQYSCMYLVPPEIYTRLLDSADAREKIKVQELNTVEVGNENGAFPSLPDTPDHTDVNTSQDNNDDDDDDGDNNDDNNDGGYGGEYNPPPNRYSSSTSTQSRHSSSTDTASETERFFQNNRLNTAQNRAFQLLGDSDDDEVFSNNFAQQPQLNMQSASSFTSSNHNLKNPTNNQTLENNIGSELERIMNDMIKIKKTALQQQKMLQNINKKAKSRFINTPNIQTTPRAIEYDPQNAISQANISFTPQNMNSPKAIEYHPQPLTIPNNTTQDVNSNRALTTATVQADIPNIQDSNITQSNNGTRKKSYVCEICKIVFISNRLLTQHKKDFHFPETKKVENEKTKDRYINWDDLLIQDSSITQPENTPRKKFFVCDICGISFSTRNLLENHKKDFHFPETGEVKRDNYVIWKDDKTKKKKRKKKNTTIISLKSSDASMNDSTKSGDRGDVSMSDSIIIPQINDTLTPSINNASMDSISVLQCKLCPATFNTQIALNRHIRNIHEADINYKNKNKQGLKRKIENTNGNIVEKTSGRKKQATHFYKCKLCGTHFKDEKVLNRHVKNIHNSNANYKYNLPQGEKRKRANSKNVAYKKWK